MLVPVARQPLKLAQEVHRAAMEALIADGRALEIEFESFSQAFASTRCRASRIDRSACHHADQDHPEKTGKAAAPIR
jgi:hypothetical protein